MLVTASNPLKRRSPERLFHCRPGFWSIQHDVTRIQRRRTEQVFVDAHGLAGALHGLPKLRGHLQYFFGRGRAGNPCTDLQVLVMGEQVEVQHLVDDFHLGGVNPWFFDLALPQQSLGSADLALRSRLRGCENWCALHEGI